jgi:hypothetical protein
MQIFINYAAVVAAAVSSMVVGFLWYGSLFKNTWMKVSGLTPDMSEAGRKSMTKGYAFQFVGSIVTAFALAFFIKIFGIDNIRGALVIALWVGLGFYATAALGSVLWEKKSWSYYFLNVSYDIVNLFVMSMILALWQ